MNINENWIKVKLFHKLVFKYKTGFCVYYRYNPLILFKVLPLQLISFFVFGEYSIFFVILFFLWSSRVVINLILVYWIFYRSLWTLLNRLVWRMPAPRARVCTRSWRVWTRKTWWTRCAWPSTNWWRSLSSIVKFSWTISMEPPVLWRSSGLSR